MDKYQTLINAKIKEILTNVGINGDYSDMFVPQDLTEYEINKHLVDIQDVDYELISYYQTTYPGEPANGLCNLWGPDVSPILNYVFNVVKTDNSATIDSVDATINPSIANFISTRDFADNFATGNPFTLFKLSNAGSFMKTGDIKKDIVVVFYNRSTLNPLNVSFTIKGNRGGLILPDGTLYVPIAGDLITLDVLETAFCEYDDSFASVAKTGDYGDLSNKPSLATVATTGDYGDLANKPSLATVATTGNYGDLSNKPDLSNYATKQYVDDAIDAALGVILNASY